MHAFISEMKQVSNLNRCRYRIAMQLIINHCDELISHYLVVSFSNLSMVECMIRYDKV